MAEDKGFVVEVTMPSGEKLEPVTVNGNVVLVKSSEIGAAVGKIVGDMIEQRLKA